MVKNNYLVDFIRMLDSLISEINKLNSKIRSYRKNSNEFGFEFNVKFFISPTYFEKLRTVILQKIEKNGAYEKKIVDLKREISREYLFLMIKMQQEIARIDYIQEKEMNKIVYEKIYNAQYEYELKNISLYDCKNSWSDKFLGIAKYRKLMIKNHELKLKIVEKEYEQKKLERKNIFELVSMIENANIKNGELLYLQDNIIKYFLIDKNTVKRNLDYSWKRIEMLPNGFFAKKAHYKILNNAVTLENEELERKLNQNKIVLMQEKAIDEKKNNTLLILNEKLSKILKANLAVD